MKRWAPAVPVFPLRARCRCPEPAAPSKRGGNTADRAEPRLGLPTNKGNVVFWADFRLPLPSTHKFIMNDPFSWVFLFGMGEKQRFSSSKAHISGSLPAHRCWGSASPGCLAPSLGSCPGTSRLRAARVCTGPTRAVPVPLGDTRAGPAAGAGLPTYQVQQEPAAPQHRFCGTLQFITLFYRKMLLEGVSVRRQARVQLFKVIRGVLASSRGSPCRCARADVLL